VGCWFDHGEAPLRWSRYNLSLNRRGGGCTQVSEPVKGTRQTRRSPAYSHHDEIAKIQIRNEAWNADAPLT
ncbi:hypothetical protein, partial [Pseudomonas sp. MYb3]|uniref:hypothetical protein n=2 Tax=unclassified Pseudomonas TaxID=196821 RepID=UPI001C466B1E